MHMDFPNDRHYILQFADYLLSFITNTAVMKNSTFFENMAGYYAGISVFKKRAVFVL